MAWFKVDDGFHSSRKLLRIPKRHRWAAAGLWAVAGSWSADQLTDGHVPDYMLEEWGVPPAAPGQLVDADLWERTSDGYLFRNWDEYQPRKEDVDAERAASRERMRELRARRKQQKPRNDGEEDGVFGRTGTNGSESVRNPDPVPTQPDPKEASLGAPQAETPRRAKRGQRLPDDWEPSLELRAQMNLECPGVDQYAQFQRFKDYWTAQPGQKGVKHGWEAT